MKPAVTQRDIALLRDNAQLPTTEDVLMRFGDYYGDCVDRSSDPVDDAEPPALPTVEASTDDAVTEDTAPDMMEEGESASVEDTVLEMEALPDPSDLSQPEEPEPEVDTTADTVLQLQAVDVTATKSPTKSPTEPRKGRRSRKGKKKKKS